MWKFLGQGSNRRPGGDLLHNCGSAGSSICCTTRDFNVKLAFNLPLGCCKIYVTFVVPPPTAALPLSESRDPFQLSFFTCRDAAFLPVPSSWEALARCVHL